MSKTQVIRDILEARLRLDGVSGGDHNYWCPFCDASHLHVNYGKGDNGAAVCHGCWYGTWDLRYLVRDLLGYIPKRLDRLVERAKWARSVEKILHEEEDSVVDDPVPLPESFRRIPYKGGGMGGLARKYLIGERGFAYDDIDRYGLGYVTDSNHPAWGCVVFPFYVRGRPVYWQGRRFAGHGPKMYNPKATGKKSLLYGYDHADGCSQAGIVEGPSDSIAWGPGGLGLTSLVLHDPQIRAISLMGFKRIIVCLDADAWGRYKKLDSGKRVPVPIHMALRLQRGTSARIGVLRLGMGDPDKNKHRLKKLIRQNTRWWDDKHDVSSRVRRILEGA